LLYQTGANPSVSTLYEWLLPGHPVHVVQRGFCRRACFYCEQDRLVYLHCLARHAARLGCCVHAYVLMPNHVHLLMTPSGAYAVSRLMRTVGERHSHYVAGTVGGTSAVWDERFDASPVYLRRYLLACMRYIELNPVRAGIVARPSDYRWSSYRSNALGRDDALILAHPSYYALGRTPAARQAGYRALFRTPVLRWPVSGRLYRGG
jgi:putative transposase